MNIYFELSALPAKIARLSLFGAVFVFSSFGAAQAPDLMTRNEQAVGLSLSQYKYQEPGYMQLKANKLGLSWSGTYAFGSTWPDPAAAWFLRTDLHYSQGAADYASPISGHLSDTPHHYVEARVVLGNDIPMAGYVIAPYVGLGYRQLHSNIGYARESRYTTVPIGLTHKVKLSDQSLLLTNLEYLALLNGQERVTLPQQRVNLDQQRGYGVRLSVIKRYRTWSLGPTLTYWSLGQSDAGGTIPVVEPANTTTELGFKVSHHF